MFSLAFWNPIFYTVALLLVVFGGLARWLTGPEVVLGGVLLAIPYVTRSYEMSMGSHARFAAVVVPSYVVLSQLLYRLPSWIRPVLLTTCAATQTVWAALFAAGYGFY